MSDVVVCATCGRLHGYAMPVCRGCGGGDLRACSLPLVAEIYSHTTVARAPTAALQAEVPYTVVLVRGARGGLLLLRWRGAGPPGIGAAARVLEEDGLLVAEDAR